MRLPSRDWAALAFFLDIAERGHGLHAMRDDRDHYVMVSILGFGDASVPAAAERLARTARADDSCRTAKTASSLYCFPARRHE
mgnify:CR=1 FL=1